MVAAIGLVVAAAGGLLLWSAVTDRSALDELKAALGVE